MKEPGYVYILTNPSFKEDWVKIGLEHGMKAAPQGALNLTHHDFAELLKYVTENF